MTASHQDKIGRRALWLVGSLKPAVIVRDVREAYGRTDYLCACVDGTGEQWISEGSLDFGVEG